MKRAILVVSFGTTMENTRNRTIGAFERYLSSSFPNFSIRRAFTSEIIIDILKDRDGIIIHTVTQALDILLAEGYSHVCILPTHIIPGLENQKMEAVLKGYKRKFHALISVPPLLNSAEDLQMLCDFLAYEFHNLPEDTALLCMGHGSVHPENTMYASLDSMCKKKGHKNFYIGTLRTYPELKDIIPQLKSGKFKNIILMPLMFVAGSHAVHDMTGRKRDSWRSALEQDGFIVECRLKGLGEYDRIQQLFLKRLKSVLTLLN